MKKELLMLIAAGLSLSSCAKINETMQALEWNRQAIDNSTQVINENAQAIQEATQAIDENRRQVEAVNQSLKKASAS